MSTTGNSGSDASEMAEKQAAAFLGGDIREGYADTDFFAPALPAENR
jgi:hypothetical protein